MVSESRIKYAFLTLSLGSNITTCSATTDSVLVGQLLEVRHYTNGFGGNGSLSISTSGAGVASYGDNKLCYFSSLTGSTSVAQVWHPRAVEVLGISGTAITDSAGMIPVLSKLTVTYVGAAPTADKTGYVEIRYI